MVRDLRGPGLLGCFLCEQKALKKSLEKLRFLRTFLNYKGVWLRYGLRISGLSSMQGTSLPLRGNDRPGSPQLPGCLAALGTRVWQGGCEFAECTVRPRAPCTAVPL